MLGVEELFYAGVVRTDQIRDRALKLHVPGNLAADCAWGKLLGRPFGLLFSSLAKRRSNSIIITTFILTGVLSALLSSLDAHTKSTYLQNSSFFPFPFLLDSPQFLRTQPAQKLLPIFLRSSLSKNAFSFALLFFPFYKPNAALLTIVV